VGALGRLRLGVRHAPGAAAASASTAAVLQLAGGDDRDEADESEQEEQGEDSADRAAGDGPRVLPALIKDAYLFCTPHCRLRGGGGWPPPSSITDKWEKVRVGGGQTFLSKGGTPRGEEGGGR